jgi:two-component system nitrogen regulation response regulator GlnG
MPKPNSATSTVFRLRGDLQGEARVFVLEQGENNVGSDPASAVHLPVNQVSREHAMLWVGPDGVHVEDLNSTNGTFVNGVRVRKARLDEDDWVQFGPVILTFETIELDEHKLGISLEETPKHTKPRAVNHPHTTEIGISSRPAIDWPEVLDVCSAALLESCRPDLGETVDRIADNIAARAIALLARQPSGEVAVLASAGDLAALKGWQESTAFKHLSPPNGNESAVSSQRLSPDPPTTLTLRWTAGNWDLALLVSEAEIPEHELRHLNAVLRMLGSTTSRAPSNECASAHDSTLGLIFPSWHVVGRTPAMQTVYRQLAALTRGTMPVLVTGETGVGKEHVVRILHTSSDRAAGPLQVVNCTAIPADLLEAELFGIEPGVATGVRGRKGKLRQADGGMLFLDEIGDMEPGLQAKLLRALEEGEVHPVGASSPITIDVRIVTATNTDLEQRVRDGRFRSDLFYRIAGCEVQVPPLRRRREDIPALAHHFLDNAASDIGKGIRGLSINALGALQRADWPGNIRQLQHELTRLVAGCPPGGTIETPMISASLMAEQADSEPEAGDLDLKRRLQDVERRLIEQALRRAKGNQSEAARLLGVSRNGLAMKLRRLGLEHSPTTSFG